jgi:hypothetical protein
MRPMLEGTRRCTAIRTRMAVHLCLLGPSCFLDNGWHKRLVWHFLRSKGTVCALQGPRRRGERSLTTHAHLKIRIPVVLLSPRFLRQREVYVSVGARCMCGKCHHLISTQCIRKPNMSNALLVCKMLIYWVTWWVSKMARAMVTTH